MNYARANNYIVVTHDLDCSTILAATHGDKPSVVQIRSENTSHTVIGSLVIAALQQMKNDLEQGALLAINTKRARLRLLPL